MNQIINLPFNPETTTVGEIVTENYHAAGVFKNYKLDFCCGGDKTLVQACEKKNINAQEVIAELSALPWGQTTSSENFKAWEPGFLVDYIQNTHHNFVRTKTEEITGYANRVAKVHGEHFPENIEVYKQFVNLSLELLRHLDDEETRVFPLINRISDLRKAGQPVSSEMISELTKELNNMEDDHEEAGSVMAEIRELTNSYQPPEGACTTYRVLYQNLAGFEEDLHKHVHLENNILFKKAQALV
ncbi:MAG: iron-sulfur cluster repair di-iron protein [Balneolales bacterium]